MSSSSWPPDSLLRQFRPTTLQLMLPERGLHERPLTTRLKHLSLDTSLRQWTGSIPPLTRLRSLQITVHQSALRAGRSSWPFVDLSLLPNLQQLHIQGDVWSRVQETSMGVSDTVKCCVLQGPLVLGKRADDLFGRLATGLQYLSVRGRT